MPVPSAIEVAKAAEEAGEEIAVAVEVEDDGMARLGRHVPDDDLFAVRRGQHDALRPPESRPPAATCARVSESETGTSAARRTAQARPPRHKPTETTIRSHFRTVMISRGRRYIPLTMFSVTFLASPSSIMVLSR